MEIFAKSFNESGKRKGETLAEHTEALLDELEIFRKLYEEDINSLLQNDSDKNSFWEDLKLACIVHDLGKVSTPFQNKIRNVLKLNMQRKTGLKEIPHNFLSPAFLTGLDEMNDTRFYTIFLSIAFHHDRTIDFDRNELIESIEKDLKNNSNAIKPWLGKNILNYSFEFPYQSYFNDLQDFVNKSKPFFNELKKTKRFILLKGLLHRLDHAASAHIPIEDQKLAETSKKLLVYLKKQSSFIELSDFQKEAVKYRNESVLLTASTGLGKTEFAINWIGESKSFYTLPLRVSSNSMFKRLNKILGDNVGILHSDSYNLIFENENLSIEENLQRYNLSKQLSKPLTVTTADQLFTSVFKWKGYEKIYSTLFYSKIILDEPQSYSPKTLAMIIKALEEISCYGGKFCYMSATNHPFIINRLKTIATELPPVFNLENKHKISLNEGEIENFVPEIEKQYYLGKKILVITNTVKKAQTLFRKISIRINKKLLHSGFIRNDREIKEVEIQNDFKKKIPVVWISTQIVEASLDIDYDLLFTEIATFDALIQRMGRIYRKKGRAINYFDKPNIFISCSKPSDEFFIYNKDICDFTKQELYKYDDKILTEEKKQKIMNDVYAEDRIKDTNFFKDYTRAYKLLDYGFEADSKTEAQELFREISQINGIPLAVYEKNSSLIDSLMNTTKNSNIEHFEKMRIIQHLMSFTLSIPAWKAKQCFKLNSERKMPLFIIPGEYDSLEGLRYKEIDNIF
ncbi:MAG: CRISPR-associated helicase Cas3' [Stygiobacter sp.]